MELSSMNEKRAGMAALSTDLGIVVVGGILENYQVTNRCELYNISTDEWKQIQSLSEPSMNSCLVQWNTNFVIKFGGKVDEDTLSKRVEIYDILKDFW